MEKSGQKSGQKTTFAGNLAQFAHQLNRELGDFLLNFRKHVEEEAQRLAIKGRGFDPSLPKSDLQNQRVEQERAHRDRLASIIEYSGIQLTQHLETAGQMKSYDLRQPQGLAEALRAAGEVFLQTWKDHRAFQKKTNEIEKTRQFFEKTLSNHDRRMAREVAYMQETGNVIKPSLRDQVKAGTFVLKKVFGAMISVAAALTKDAAQSLQNLIGNSAQQGAQAAKNTAQTVSGAVQDLKTAAREQKEDALSRAVTVARVLGDRVSDATKKTTNIFQKMVAGVKKVVDQVKTVVQTIGVQHAIDQREKQVTRDLTRSIGTSSLIESFAAAKTPRETEEALLAMRYALQNDRDAGRLKTADVLKAVKAVAQQDQLSPTEGYEVLRKIVSGQKGFEKITEMLNKAIGGHLDAQIANGFGQKAGLLPSNKKDYPTLQQGDVPG